MLIYAAIAALGLVLLLVMLIAGDIFGGDHDFDHGDADHGGGASIFSVRIMAAFLTAFGVGGVVARYYALSHPAASGIGVVAGIVMAAVVYQFAKLLYSQQASSELRMTGLVGASAEVSVAIPEGGVGQISLSSGGERTEHIARSANGQAVPRGTAVTITALGGHAVIVAPADRQATGGSR